MFPVGGADLALVPDVAPGHHGGEGQGHLSVAGQGQEVEGQGVDHLQGGIKSFKFSQIFQSNKRRVGILKM